MTLLDAMLGLAVNFDPKAVAERIETDEQLAILRRKGCQSGQGSLFSPAVAAEDAHLCFGRSWGAA